MSESKQKSEGSLFILLAIALVIGAFYLAAHPHLCHGQTPNLTISAGATVGGPGLAISSDSNRTWKRFAVSSGSGGAWSIVSAEHGTGDDGGIYFYTLTASAGTIGAPSGSGTVTPPGPSQEDLPLNTLSTAVSAAVAGVDPASVATMAGSYEALAKQIDAGTIVSPLQLQVAAGTQLLTAFDVDQIASFKGFTVAVSGWFDAQQCAGKLTADRMDYYARAYHAIAAALKPVAKAGSASGKLITRKSTSSAEAPAAAPSSPCANGNCPVQSQPEATGWFRRWRDR